MFSLSALKSMGYDQNDIYVPQCFNVLWSVLDKNLEVNNLIVLTVNARGITGSFEDLEKSC